MNLFHTFPNMNISSWIYFFAGHNVDDTGNLEDLPRLVCIDKECEMSS